MTPPRDTSRTELRIIGGRWRGRKLRFNGSGVRPTGDRVRETLFNWLAPHLPGSRCLDLFAGSGALGIEALSRGAAAAVLVERDRDTAAQVRAALTDLGAGTAGEVLHADALTVLAGSMGRTAAAGFDIVFLDPPFAASAASPQSPPGLALGNLCTLLEQSSLLTPQARVYLEMDRQQALPELPANWRVLREKTAGQVRYALAQRQAG